MGGEHVDVAGPPQAGPRFIPAWAGNTGRGAPPTREPSVHPRVGGEHNRILRRLDLDFGSSPRGRGTRCLSARREGWSAVHPRVGGEHLTAHEETFDNNGSSPRGRGTHRVGVRSRAEDRFIPAWAGNTQKDMRSIEFEQGSSPRGRGTLRQYWPELILRRFIPAWAGNTRAGRAARRARPVHPRVGGEHQAVSLRSARLVGSSPRGRGTPLAGPVATFDERFIPAWAGNTRYCEAPYEVRRVHPRVGGEHALLRSALRGSAGSSPRGRGTRRQAVRQQTVGRFIPAWAGNTPLSAAGGIPRPVHPRVGGEHTQPALTYELGIGSSPRGRGTPQIPLVGIDIGRFIPAWAGNTPVQVAAEIRAPVHPRVGGEHAVAIAGDGSGSGSSPRGRGTHRPARSRDPGLRFIPAWAGNTLEWLMRPGVLPVHPRVGGEHMRIIRFWCFPFGSSPRGRGTPHTLRCQNLDARFIPAWAGNTRCTRIRGNPTTVHPRVGGEHLRVQNASTVASGSSPRGRGTPNMRTIEISTNRFIPAWAGNT